MNRLYRTELYGEKPWQHIFQSKVNWGFDEFFMSALLMYKHIPCYVRDVVADIHAYGDNFRIVHTSLGQHGRFISHFDDQSLGMVFSYDKGTLLGHSLDADRAGDIKSREYMYIHLQKRSMDIESGLLDNLDKFSIIPNMFIKQDVTPALVRKYTVVKYLGGKFSRDRLAGLCNAIRRRWEYGDYYKIVKEMSRYI